MKPTTEGILETNIDKWVVTDSDGTVIPLHSDATISVPPPEFIEKLREFSFNHPRTGIMVLSGRKDEDLTRFYSAAFKANPEGKIPAIVLASENGALLRFSTDPENVHPQTQPLSENLKERIRGIIKKAAGDYYTEGFNNHQVSIRAEMKTFGITVHIQIPSTPSDKTNRILDQIKEEFQNLVKQNPDLHADYNAANAFTLERVSKGITMEKLADYDPSLVTDFTKSGLASSKPKFISYSGDDRGDWTALNVLNERLNSGVLEGYTLRPNNYSPNALDVKSRIPNGPKEMGTGDSFYALGSKEISAQEQHRQDFLDQKTLEDRNTLRVELSKRGLLPSQSTNAQAPPIVLLITGDILLQEPAHYQTEALDQLKNWTHGKIILMANGTDLNIEKIKQLGLGKNKNLIAISPEAQIYSTEQQLDLRKTRSDFNKNNEIFSANTQRSSEIALLRVIQDLLLSNGLLQHAKQVERFHAAILPADDRKKVPSDQLSASSLDISSNKKVHVPATSLSEIAVKPRSGKRTGSPTHEKNEISKKKRTPKP